MFLLARSSLLCKPAHRTEGFHCRQVPKPIRRLSSADVSGVWWWIRLFLFSFFFFFLVSFSHILFFLSFKLLLFIIFFIYHTKFKLHSVLSRYVLPPFARCFPFSSSSVFMNFSFLRRWASFTRRCRNPSQGGV